MKPTQTIVRKKTQRDYSLSFKLTVVEQVEKGQLTPGEAQIKYGIQGHSTVLVGSESMVAWTGQPKGNSL